jgi:hypothetical protein
VAWVCLECAATVQIHSIYNTIPFDHKLGSPKSQLGVLPDIIKPPIVVLRQVTPVTPVSSHPLAFLWRLSQPGDLNRCAHS